LIEIIKKNLPDIPVLSALGNHEFFPVNVMNFDSTDPMISSLAEVWANQLSDEA